MRLLEQTCVFIFPHLFNSFRVGFLNRDSPEAREKYQKLYDIVIVDDESLSVPIKIVQAILSVDSE